VIGETTQATPQTGLRVVQVEGEPDLYPHHRRESQQAGFCSFNSHLGKFNTFPNTYPNFILCFQRRIQNETPQMLKQGAVLSPEEMNELCSDMEHMHTPSWLTSVPANLGKPSHGKLKADQWCTLGTTYLPVSLICLWDRLEYDDQCSRQCKKLLAVTLSLISAVIVASSRTTSQEKADLYLHHMQTYLNGLCKLFPQYRFLPNQHMALHLAEYLRFYGPVHSWWTFPFERLIGMLQRIPNNFQDGKFHLHISLTIMTFIFSRATGRNHFYHLHEVCQPSSSYAQGRLPASD
jgi:hypothetical protein